MKRLRPDGRSANQLRPLAAEFGVLSTSDGSARLCLGDTRVLVGVFGPRPAKSLRFEDPHRATLEVVVLPPSGPAGKAEADLELALHAVFDGVLVSDAFPRCVVSVHVQVLHDDGALLPAALNCVTLALVDAGVPLAGLVAAVSCGMDDSGVVGRGGGGAHAPPPHPSSDVLFDLLPAEEAGCRVGATVAFQGAGGPGPLFVRQVGLATWEESAALLGAARHAGNTVLAFLRLAIGQKVARDAACVG